jgi:hypothetical protein
LDRNLWHMKVMTYRAWRLSVSNYLGVRGTVAAPIHFQLQNAVYFSWRPLNKRFQ